MFETIEGFADNIVAVRGVGRVTADDYGAVLGPALARATADGRKVRLLLELGDGFEGYDVGGLLADTQLGFSEIGSFERICVVTNTDWIRHAVHLFGPLIPGDVRVFAVSEAPAAREWIGGR